MFGLLYDKTPTPPFFLFNVLFFKFFTLKKSALIYYKRVFYLFIKFKSLTRAHTRADRCRAIDWLIYLSIKCGRGQWELLG